MDYKVPKVHTSSGRYPTEILSKGLEMLLRDPAGFAAADPEYCGFVLGILDGSLRDAGQVAARPTLDQQLEAVDRRIADLLTRPLSQPKPPRFGMSRATVEYPGHADREQVLAVAKEILGRPVTQRDLASVAGAPDAARVEALVASRNRSIKLRVELPDALRSGCGFSRTRAGLVLDNGDIDMAPAQRRHGVALKLIGRQVEALARFGFNKARLLAARRDSPDPDEAQAGYKVWPFFGYDAKIPVDVRQALPAALGHAETLLDLYATEEGQQVWERHGRTITMEFDMAKNSRSRKTLDELLRRKADQGELKQAPLTADGKAPEWPDPHRKPYCDPGDLGDLHELRRLVFGDPKGTRNEAPA